MAENEPHEEIREFFFLNTTLEMKCALKEGFVCAQFTTGLSGIFTPGGKAAGFVPAPAPQAFCSHPS